uniref:Retrovirus-related Pol polyprotein from transposon 17.6 n=1 Tax=Schistocephalus solidus TaxID=70667 RepID=A0A0X3Q3N7_SCHSO
MYHKPPGGRSAKFNYPWQGPFVVLHNPYPNTLLLRDAINSNAQPLIAHSDRLKPYYGRLPVCSPESLPILAPDQVPPVVIEVTVPSHFNDSSTEDSAAS